MGGPPPTHATTHREHALLHSLGLYTERDIWHTPGLVMPEVLTMAPEPVRVNVQRLLMKQLA